MINELELAVFVLSPITHSRDLLSHFHTQPVCHASSVFAYKTHTFCMHSPFTCLHTYTCIGLIDAVTVVKTL